MFWWQRGRHFCLFENCLLENLLLVRVSLTFLHFKTSYALQFSSASPLAKKKVRVAALWGLVGPPSGDGALAVALDASSRSSFWRPRAPLASGPSSSSEITSLLINFYPFGTRIFPFSKEKYNFLKKIFRFWTKNTPPEPPSGALSEAPFWLILAAGASKKSIRTQYFCLSKPKKCFLYKPGADFYIFADLLGQALGRPYAAATKYTPFRASS